MVAVASERKPGEVFVVLDGDDWPQAVALTREAAVNAHERRGIGSLTWVPAIGPDGEVVPVVDARLTPETVERVAFRHYRREMFRPGYSEGMARRRWEAVHVSVRESYMRVARGDLLAAGFSDEGGEPC